MMLRLTTFLFLLLMTCSAQGQKIVYSEPDKDETKRMNFEIIGKVSGNYLIYKQHRGKHLVSVYDNEMVEIAKEELSFIPDDRLINIDFVPYAEHAYVIYEYQRRNVVYCNAVKLDGNAKKLTDVIELDTTHIGLTASNKIYSAMASEDRSKIMVFKVNARNKSRYLITTLLFDNLLALQKRSRLVVPMEDKNDYLGDFNVDNDGDLVFAKYGRSNQDNIPETYLIYKPAMSDSMLVTNLGLEKIFLDEVHIKVDNTNKRYFLTSFYYKQKRGNVDGFYFVVWDKVNKKVTMENTMELTEEMKKEARPRSSLKSAFNDYFIRNIIVKKDGGFIIGSEAYYTASRLGNWNRWDYLYGLPYTTGYDYYSYSPFYNSWYTRNRYNYNQSLRHHADHITIFSFDNKGRLEWSNVIHKEQYDDETDMRISYQLMNTGGQLHFLFNLEEKRAQLLNDYVVSPSGNISRNPTLKNLDRNFEFLPKVAKQVSSKQIIVPCYYRNYICFAKIDYN